MPQTRIVMPPLRGALARRGVARGMWRSRTSVAVSIVLAVLAAQVVSSADAGASGGVAPWKVVAHPTQFTGQMEQYASGKCVEFDPLTSSLGIEPCLQPGAPNRSFQLFTVTYRPEYQASTIFSIA